MLIMIRNDEDGLNIQSFINSDDMVDRLDTELEEIAPRHLQHNFWSKSKFEQALQNEGYITSRTIRGDESIILSVNVVSITPEEVVTKYKAHLQ